MFTQLILNRLGRGQKCHSQGFADRLSCPVCRWKPGKLVTRVTRHLSLHLFFEATPWTLIQKTISMRCQDGNGRLVGRSKGQWSTWVSSVLSNFLPLLPNRKGWTGLEESGTFFSPKTSCSPFLLSPIYIASAFRLYNCRRSSFQDHCKICITIEGLLSLQNIQVR